MPLTLSFLASVHLPHTKKQDFLSEIKPNDVMNAFHLLIILYLDLKGDTTVINEGPAGKLPAIAYSSNTSFTFSPVFHFLVLNQSVT